MGCEVHRARVLSLTLLMLSGCVARPQLIGPPRTLSSANVRASLGAAWNKPIDSSALGAPQIEGGLHLPAGEGFDLAVRGWTTGGGIQGRLRVASVERGQGVDFLVAPIVAIGVVAGLDVEEQFLPPFEVEFMAGVPLVLGIGAGRCSAYAGVDPVAHIRPDRFVLRGGPALGIACPTEQGRWFAPEIAFNLPWYGGKVLRPADGVIPPGVTRHPLIAQTITAGLTVSF